ncbi:hypothetical protein C5167_047088 [Papaver somniferum]|uniref:B box-type domain-containing protein n=1 Tax=Papaver somniferum TaxID=3469 RepID=A0A4Y7LHV9_PAPSO|nr:hypothetical protein C5167_047088 [Papaver somniferum]
MRSIVWLSFYFSGLNQFTWLVGSDNCQTLIVDLHRSCSNCSYDLCLSCFREIRDGMLPGGAKEKTEEYIDRGTPHMHAKELKPSKGLAKSSMRAKKTKPSKGQARLLKRATNEWKIVDTGSISCASCCSGILELKYILPDNCVSELVNRAEQISKQSIFDDPATPTQQRSCFNSVSDVDIDSSKLRRSVSQKGKNSNCLYSPEAKEIQHGDMENFQKHWVKGEPVIVRNVQELTSGLSWEPNVMCQALREKTTSRLMKGSEHLVSKAVDCMNLCKVEELRFLPRKHIAKEDKLEVKKMILSAVDRALNQLECHFKVPNGKHSSNSAGKLSPEQPIKGKASINPKAEPSKEAAIVEILKEVDFETTTFNDICQ